MTTLAEAQTATAAAAAAAQAAKDASASLMSRLGDGDSSVTGSDLIAAEADLRAAEMLLQGAQRRQILAQEEEQKAAAAAAAHALLVSYQETSAAFSAAIPAALAALDALFVACCDHRDRTQAAYRTAVAIDPAGPLTSHGPLRLPGVGQVHQPAPAAVIDAVATIILQRHRLVRTASDALALLRPFHR